MYEYCKHYGEQQTIVGDADDEEGTIEEDVVMLDVDPTIYHRHFFPMTTNQDNLPEEADELGQMFLDVIEDYIQGPKCCIKNDSEIPMYPNCKPKYTKLSIMLQFLQM